VLKKVNNQGFWQRDKAISGQELPFSGCTFFNLPYRAEENESRLLPAFSILTQIELSGKSCGIKDVSNTHVKPCGQMLRESFRLHWGPNQHYAGEAA